MKVKRERNVFAALAPRRSIDRSPWWNVCEESLYNLLCGSEVVPVGHMQFSRFKNNRVGSVFFTPVLILA